VSAPEKGPRGFAALTPEQRREIASMGGKAAHAQGRGHRFTSEEARAAGRKGGQAAAAIPGNMSDMGRKGGRATSSDREHMATIGRKGGEVMATRPGHMREIGRRGGTARSR
jgi:general stress protein YciG